MKILISLREMWDWLRLVSLQLRQHFYVCHKFKLQVISWSDEDKRALSLPVTLIGMTHELMTWELLFILSSGVGSGSALDQLVCLSRVEGMLGMGNLDRWPKATPSVSGSEGGACNRWIFAWLGVLVRWHRMTINVINSAAKKDVLIIRLSVLSWLHGSRADRQKGLPLGAECHHGESSQ